MGIWTKARCRRRNICVRFWVVLVLGAAACLLLTQPAQAQQPARPNFVLIVSDDHGCELGCYGNPVIRTPNLDRLAAEGTRFEFAFCTTASCSPSRSVILTGMHSHANGTYGLQHSYHHFQSFDNIKSLPVYLQEAGYRTILAGKLHVAPESVYRFEHVVQGVNPRSTVEMAERCRELLSQQSDRPFFLYFCPTDPHRGGGRVEGSPYRPDRFGNREKPYPGVNEVVYDPRDVIVPPWLPDTPTCRAELAQYYRSISRMDQGIGRLMDILRETGHWERTVVIYISDNGPPFPGAKTTVYEPGIRLPCIVRHPAAQRKGVVSQAMISWVDIAPTILDMAGLRVPSTMQGRSFARILEEENPPGWDEVYASHTFHEVTMYYPMRVVRERRFKLIWNIAWPLPYPFASDLWEAATFQDRLALGLDTPYGRRTLRQYIHRPQFELYDLEADPFEARNLADDPAYADVLARLKAKLREFQEKTGDPWILKWERE
ncbi:MAG: sulfatase [Thermoguttaceae bacterium]|nr:sulfatase [Thermoguttaceae bacterium]MDW8079471.1 sulfatase [Thermoguttaceae bacterium]